MLIINQPKLSQIVQCLDGEIKGSDVDFKGFSIDSRTIKSGNLFVAIKGDNFDGHRFLMDAKKSGAAAGLVSEFIEIDLPQIKVTNTMLALTTLAKKWRDSVDIPVIGITGSNGKTTVKEMVANILSTQSKGLKTEGNFNNHIGVPLTLLRLTTEHKWAVIEMGANHNGEIAELVAIAKPTISLINNISNAHIGGFGTLNNTAKTKGAIFANLPNNGVAIMPNGSQYLDLWRGLSTASKTILFGNENTADVYFNNQNGQFEICTNDDGVKVEMPIKATHIYCNAVAAAAIATQLEMSLADIKKGLEHVSGIKGRLQSIVLKNGAVIVDDTYNANPASVRVAMDYLQSLGGRTIFVLGDMGELSTDGKTAHQEIGAYAQSVGIGEILSVGILSQFAGGQHFSDKDKLATYLKNKLTKNSKVLIKGSRFMQMDDIVKSLSVSKNIHVLRTAL